MRCVRARRDGEGGAGALRVRKARERARRALRERDAGAGEGADPSFETRARGAQERGAQWKGRDDRAGGARPNRPGEKSRVAAAAAAGRAHG